MSFRGKLSLTRPHAHLALGMTLAFCLLISLAFSTAVVAFPGPPAIPRITSKPPTNDNHQVATFGFSADPADTAFVSGFLCKFDSGNFAACSSPYSTPSLTPGPHSFAVEVKDVFSGTSQAATYSWTIDIAPPVAPSLGQNRPANPSSSSVANFTYTGESGAVFQCSLDAVAFADCPALGQGYTNLTDGQHSFSVRDRDAAGNTSPVASYTWLIDTKPPETTIDSKPDPQSNVSAATFAFHSSKPLSTFQCRLDGSDWASCSSAKTYSGLSVAQHSFEVRAIDVIGNVDPTPASWVWAVVKSGDGGGGGNGGGGGGAKGRHHHRVKPSHVFVIVMENKEYGSVIGSRSAPFSNQIAHRYASASGFYALTHPSLPNYLAMLGGSTFGVSSDCLDCTGIGGRTFADQLSAKRISWRAYMEGMPSRCFLGDTFGNYAKKHNPFMYFRSIAGDQSCHNVVPGRQLSRDLRGNRLADFSWITPDLCNDTHDCAVRKGDRWLHRIVPRLLGHVGSHGFVVVTWDEGTSKQGGGGRIPTIFLGPDVRRHGQVGRRYSTYSLLKTLERYFSVGYLGQAAHARSMDEMFEDSRIRRPEFR